MALTAVSMGRGGGSTTVDLPHSFSSGTVAVAAEVNANFAALADGVNVASASIDQVSAGLDAIDRPANVINVAKSGTAYNSLRDALQDITDSASDNPYIVVVAPGEYVETELTDVGPYISVRGSGQGITTLRANRASASSNPVANGSVIRLQEGASLTDLTVKNEGGGAGRAVGVFMSDVSRRTLLQNVTTDLVAGAAPSAEYTGVYVENAEPTIRDCTLLASGGTSQNQGFLSRGIAGVVRLALIEDCRLEGIGGTRGVGATLSDATADFSGCSFLGSAAGLGAFGVSSGQVRGCKVETVEDVGVFGPCFDVQEQSRVRAATTLFVSGNPFTAQAGLTEFVHCYKRNYDPVVDGPNSVVEPF